METKLYWLAPKVEDTSRLPQLTTEFPLGVAGMAGPASHQRRLSSSAALSLSID